MFFRRDRSDDEWLQVKIGIFAVGAVLALLGMGLGNDWLVAAAAVVLASGVVLRFLT